MATRLRKVRHLRGSRTHGWGQVAQHRRTGAKGGSGMAGMHKHKWSYTVKYAPDHFGSNEWHPPHPSVTGRWVNVGELEKLSGNSSDLDLSSIGYDKLLGQGVVSKALKIKVTRASESAVRKVKAAGGSVEVEFEHVSPDEKKGQENQKSPEKGKQPSKVPSKPRDKGEAGH